MAGRNVQTQTCTYSIHCQSNTACVVTGAVHAAVKDVALLHVGLAPRNRLLNVMHLHCLCAALHIGLTCTSCISNIPSRLSVAYMPYALGLANSPPPKSPSVAFQLLFASCSDPIIACLLNTQGSDIICAFHSIDCAWQSCSGPHPSHSLPPAFAVQCRTEGSKIKTSMQMVVEAASRDDSGHMDMEFLKVHLIMLHVCLV